MGKVYHWLVEAKNSGSELTNYFKITIICTQDKKYVHILINVRRISMIKVTATKLRKDLFHYLDQAADGEIIVIQRNNKEVARLVAVPQQDWREKMNTQLKFLVPADELVQPIEDIWEDYI